MSGAQRDQIAPSEAVARKAISASGVGHGFVRIGFNGLMQRFKFFVEIFLFLAFFKPFLGLPVGGLRKRQAATQQNKERHQAERKEVSYHSTL